MNKETMQVADFQKKPYATPEIKVYAVEDEDIICTSDTVATQNEEYEVNSTSGWFGY